MSLISTTMKAWTFSQRGQPLQVLILDHQVPIPQTVQADEVMVKISCAALNPFGYTMIWALPTFIRTKPSIPEFDFSGQVVKLGESQTKSELKVGDAVFGFVQPQQGNKGKGALAEYVVVPRGQVALKPELMSFEAASGLPTTNVTAWLVLEKSRLQTGDKVFINGGSGGVGLAMIQMARDVVGPDGKVVVTCSATNEEIVKSVGADEASRVGTLRVRRQLTPSKIIDYTQHKSLPGYLASRYSSRPFDAIIDAVGQSQALYNHSPKYLARGKPFLCIGTYLGDKLTFRNVLRTMGMMLQNTMWPSVLGGTRREWMFVNGEEGGPRALGAVQQKAHVGKLKVQIDSIFDMEDALKAYERIMSRRACGKVIIKVQDV